MTNHKFLVAAGVVVLFSCAVVHGVRTNTVVETDDFAQSASKSDVELQENTTIASDDSLPETWFHKCFCKTVKDAEACDSHKHSETDPLKLRYFSKANAEGAKCCKWATSKANAGMKYFQSRANDFQTSECQRLPPRTCCHSHRGVNFYIEQMSVNKWNGLHANLANMVGADLGEKFIPHWLLYKSLEENWGESPYFCEKLEFDADKCELGLDEDTFQMIDVPEKACCHDKQNGLNYYIDKQLFIKGLRDEPFVARRLISGAYVNGDFFPGAVIARYVKSLPRHMTGLNGLSEEWPYFCDPIVPESEDKCELVPANSERMPWHSIRVNDLWSTSGSGCCQLTRQKVQFYVRQTYQISTQPKDTIQDLTTIDDVETASYNGQNLPKEAVQDWLLGLFPDFDHEVIKCDKILKGDVSCQLRYTEGRPDNPDSA